MQLIEKIANKEGLGALVIEGLQRASETIGKDSERYACRPRARLWLRGTLGDDTSFCHPGEEGHACETAESEEK